MPLSSTYTRIIQCICTWNSDTCGICRPTTSDRNLMASWIKLCETGFWGTLQAKDFMSQDVFAVRYTLRDPYSPGASHGLVYLQIWRTYCLLYLFCVYSRLDAQGTVYEALYPSWWILNQILPVSALKVEHFPGHFAMYVMIGPGWSDAHSVHRNVTSEPAGTGVVRLDGILPPMLQVMLGPYYL